MTPAETIRARRISSGLSQAALAEKMGLKEQQIQAWEHGRRNPSAKSADRLRKALGGELTDYLAV